MKIKYLLNENIINLFLKKSNYIKILILVNFIILMILQLLKY
jgi:hypothetical protein